MSVSTVNQSRQPSFFEREAKQLKQYVENKIKNIIITIAFQGLGSAIKSNQMLIGASLIALSSAVCSLAIPLLLFPVIGIFDYLDHTYFYDSREYGSINSITTMFSRLKLEKVSHALTKALVNNSSAFNELKEDKDLMTEDEAFLVGYAAFLVGYDEELNEKAQREQEAREKDTRPILLILQAKSDHNGALNLFKQDYAIKINDDNFTGVQKLTEKYTIVLIDDIDHVDKIKEDLEGIADNRIQEIWFLAHGNPTSMRLDDNNEINVSNLEQLTDPLQKKLAKDAHLVFFSCSTGKKVTEGDNIALKFSKNLLGRTIWAPKLDASRMSIDLGDDFSTKVSFFAAPKSRLQYLKEKVCNIFYLQPLKEIDLRPDITARFKDGIECSA